MRAGDTGLPAACCHQRPEADGAGSSFDALAARGADSVAPVAAAAATGELATACAYDEPRMPVTGSRRRLYLQAVRSGMPKRKSHHLSMHYTQGFLEQGRIHSHHGTISVAPSSNRAVV